MKFKGLSDKEVELSRQQHGSNAIPDSEPTTFWQEFLETFSDPMIRILLAIAALMIVMCIFGYAEIYEPLGTIIAVIIVAVVSAKTGVASDTKYRELKNSTKKDQCKVLLMQSIGAKAIQPRLMQCVRKLTKRFILAIEQRLFMNYIGVIIANW